MIFKLYKSNIGISLIATPIIVLLLCFSVFFNEYQSEIVYYPWLEKPLMLINKEKWLSIVLSSILIVINAFLLNITFNKTNFFSKTSTLPSIIYVIFLSTYFGFYFQIDLIFQLLIIISLNLAFGVNQNEEAHQKIFIISFLLSTVVVFSPIYFMVLLFPFTLLSSMRPFVLREYVSIILGMLIAAVYFYSIQYIITGVISELNLKWIFENKIDNKFHLFDYIAFSLLFAISFFSLFQIARFYKRNTNINQKHTMLIFYVFVFLSVSFYFSHYFFNQSSYYIIIPIVLFVSMSSNNSKSDTFTSLAFTALLLLNLYRLYFL